MEDKEKVFKWDSHHSTFSNAIRSLRYKGTYTDVTLACNGKLYPLHKFVLSISSDYFSKILEGIKCTNPVIILTGIQCSDMESLIDYMYTGEVNVRKDRISSFIKAAQSIRINCLEFQNEETISSNITEKQSPHLEAKITEQSPEISYTSQTLTSKCSNEQGEEYLISENNLEKTEQTKDMSTSDEVEDVSDTEHYLEPMIEDDDHLSNSDYDDSDLPCSSSVKDYSKNTEILPDVVSETSNPQLKRKITSEDASVSKNKFPCNPDNNFEDKLEIIQGRFSNSYNAIYNGYRYKQSGKILRRGGNTHWSCILKNKGCQGRIHTRDDKHVIVKHEHSHRPNLSDCIIKIVIAKIKHLATTTQTKHSEIIAQTISCLPAETKKKLPSKGSLKKQIDRARRQANMSVSLLEEEEDVSNTKYDSSTDLSDDVQTIVEYDTLSPIDYDNRDTESLPGAVAEENSTSLKRRRSGEDILKGQLKKLLVGRDIRMEFL